MRVAVTGSLGKVGRAAAAALAAAGHQVFGLDLRPEAGRARTARCDCSNFGEVMGALSGIDALGARPDAVVHLAGIPAPSLSTDQHVFENNTLATYNVFSACVRLGINRVVWASSETILGLPFRSPPDFVPLDESHPDRPEWSYALSKQVCETMADAFIRWRPAMSIASLRFSNVYDREDYAQVPTIQANPATRRFNLWAYVDAEDAGEACRLAVEAGFSGHQRLIIAAADTLLDQPTTEALGQAFPEVPSRQTLQGFASTLSSAKARRVIGYEPRWSWRQRLL
jgi:nucleoside-diphosphate-sugar epimerase